MKKLNRKVTAVFMAGAVALCLTACRASAEIVFQADFSGPGNSKTGSPYDGVTTGGILAQLYGNAYTSTKLQGDNPMAAEGGYLSSAISTNFTLPLNPFNIARFTPHSAATSMDAMTSVTNGDRVINGGLDFFFRSNKSITKSELRAVDMDNKSKGGLRFVFASSVSGGLILEVLSNDNGLLTGGEGGAAVKALSVTGPFQMVSNTVYHLGLTFATDAAGTVTAKLWGQAGTNAIVFATATPVATLTFGINEAVVTNGFVTGDFYLSQIRYENITPPVTQDFDQFRIYNATPDAFGALQTPAAAWLDSKPAVVLQADFNGTGGGTGGADNIVTLGGTGALVDPGTYSDAVVTDAKPFREYSKGYLSVLTTNNTYNIMYGRAAITPASPANSLAAINVVTNNQRCLRGGFDFFFRADKNINNAAASEFRPIDCDNRSAGGLRLALYSYTPNTQMALEILAPVGSLGLFSGGEGGTPATSFIYGFGGQLFSNTIYHVGVSFSSDDAGNVTAATWLKEGAGAIDLRRDMPAGAVTFGINEAVVTNGLSAGVVDFGKLRQVGDVPSTQEFDTFRIYRDTPLIFSELPSVPPMGTIISIN